VADEVHSFARETGAGDRAAPPSLVLAAKSTMPAVQPIGLAQRADVHATEAVFALASSMEFSGIRPESIQRALADLGEAEARRVGHSPDERAEKMARVRALRDVNNAITVARLRSEKPVNKIAQNSELNH
jgi:hypothetical protein